MLKSYEAILENGQVIWVADQPSVQSARAIVTILEEPVARSSRRTAAVPSWMSKTGNVSSNYPRYAYLGLVHDAGV
jgi:hypothetical protein